MARNRNRTRNNSIKILSETPANRCEICHKSDEYDSELNTCNRCVGITQLGLIDDDWTGLSANNNEANHLDNPNPNRINISRNNTLLADGPNPSNPFDQLNQIYSSNYSNNFNQASFSQPNEVNQVEEVSEINEVIQIIEEVEEVKATDENSTLNGANIDDDTDALEEMDKSYLSYEPIKAYKINELNKLSDSNSSKIFNREILNGFRYQLKYGSLNYRPIIVGLMAIAFIICIFFVPSHQNSKSPSLYDLTVKNGKIIKDEILTVNTEVDKTNSVESENTSDTNSTEVEEIPYQLDLSLANPQDNPYVTLAVDGVTVIESDEPILKVINGSESLAIEATTFPTKKIYLIGKDTLDSGNLILITKTSVFSLYYEIRTDAIPGNFNILVKIKRETNNHQ
ncbi:MAG: hypothetical protein WAQ98_27115 [Blastocatellia bacterium]